ncbi:uncharacterized protein LOC129226255 [Uloborus diversus]|uniref:uncharacterized protein LOC129226255 n=1 Tax=Uloborus diversus TaxID=327109 RepID=UPI00240A8B11|nr:uncharacterized protein LOC129226255 [Uloborus diversus]
MKVFTPRNIFAECCDCTPKQWIGLCNTFMLLLITIMCGLVIYETYDIDQRFISILDSSALAIDLTNTGAAESETTPYWRNVTENVAVYSAFYDSANIQDSFLVIIGRITKNWTSSEDLRCLIKYPDDEIRLVNISMVRRSSCNSAVLYCSTIKEIKPEKVAVISLADAVPKQWLEVEVYDSSRRMDSGEVDVAACVCPHQNSLKVEDVADFVAYYEVIGVKTFYFYVHSPPSEVSNFLRRLKSNGHEIHIQSWAAESGVCPDQVIISEYVQDCIHRSVEKHSEIVLVNIKDFIFPKQYLLIDVLTDIRQTTTNSSIIALKHKIFCDDYSNDAYEPSAMYSTTVNTEIMSPDMNYIIKPYPVSEITANKISEDEFSKEFILSEEEALVHRYESNCSSTTTFDKDGNKYLPFFKKSPVFAELRKNML